VCSSDLFADDLPVIMTEKDAVKCRAFAADHCWYLQVAAQPSSAFACWFAEQLKRLLTDSF
jgi:tetraacyldisaccharide 4'-kinase